jgi:hypothetical protein
MPFAKDPEKGGTNKDGSRSTMYCSRCFKDGTFTNPEINTPEKMRLFVKGKMQSMGFPSFVAKVFTMGIPNLARWKKKEDKKN